MLSKQYQRWRRKATKLSVIATQTSQSTHNLILNRHDSEVDDLHRRPDHPVGLQRRDVDILELALYGALATTLSDGHEGEETGKT